MDRKLLSTTAERLVDDPKGILAADESTPTLTKRFTALGIKSSPQTRRAYRESLFSAPGLGDFISGVIMYDETFRDTMSDGTLFPEFLESAGILSGIKVDTGAKPLAGAPTETVTEGLDGLRERLAEYRDLGASFAKWRAVISVGEGLPSSYCMATNAHALGRYAALCQEAGIVPIVEPEVLMDGDHTIERSREATTAMLTAVFEELAEQRVHLEGMVLKANMVLPGKDCPEQSSVEEVAEATVSCLEGVVPPEVPGIAFLSGGQGNEAASAHLNAMNRLGRQLPWQLSFSYGRALQGPALNVFSLDQTATSQVQAALLHRARMSSLAHSGRYAEQLDRPVHPDTSRR